MKKSTSRLLSIPPVLPPGMAREGTRHVPSAFVLPPSGRGGIEETCFTLSPFPEKSAGFLFFGNYLLNPVESSIIIKKKTAAVGR